MVSGDDFGAAREVNTAIVAAHRSGILTSTSLMVTGEAAAEAVALAKEHPRLAVGLHLVLAQGRAAAPSAEIPHLVTGAGSFRDRPILAGLRYAWEYVARSGRVELRREIEAQLAAFASTGLRLAHLDGHLNMHLHPMVLPILLELAPRYAIRAMRLTREDPAAALAGGTRQIGAFALERFQNESFVGLDDPAQLDWLVERCGRQEPVTPAEGRAAGHAAAFAFATLSPVIKASACASQRSFLRRCASGVPVKPLNVRRQSRQR